MPTQSMNAQRDIAAVLHPYTHPDHVRKQRPLVTARGEGVYVPYSQIFDWRSNERAIDGLQVAG
jgi:hypothetical protein